jgi:hypothetical protein
MSIRTLSEAIFHYGRDAYLQTIGNDGPHTSRVTIDLRGDSIGCAVGATISENIAREPKVSLFWPPAEPGGYSLIVNGVAADDRPRSQATTEMALTKAVLHRPGSKHDDNDVPCGADCRILTRPAGLQLTKSRVTSNDERSSITSMQPKEHSASQPTTSEYTRGALYGLAAVSIWAGWMVTARFGLKTNLTS